MNRFASLLVLLSAVPSLAMEVKLIGQTPPTTATAPAESPPQQTEPAPPAHTAHPTDAPVAQPTAAPETPPTKIYFWGIEHLAEVVAEDPVVGPRGRSLANRATTSKVLVWGGTAAGVGLLVASFLIPSETCTPYSCYRHINYGLLLSGLFAGTLLPTAGWLVAPSTVDVIHVANAWNERHPKKQIDLGLAYVNR